MELWAELDEFKLMLYPYMEGTHGYDVELSESQWADADAALASAVQHHDHDPIKRDKQDLREVVTTLPTLV